MKINKLIAVFCALQSMSISLMADGSQEEGNESKQASLSHLQLFLRSLAQCNIPITPVKESFKAAMHQIKQGISQNATMTDPQIVEIAIAQVGEDVSKFIQQYEIKDQKTLIIVAKLVAKENGEAVSKYIQNYGIEDPSALVEIAKIAAEQNGEGVSKYIQNYGIKESATLREIAKIAAKQNGAGTYQYIENYGINDDDFLKEVIAVAKIADINPLQLFKSDLALIPEAEMPTEVASQNEVVELVTEDNLQMTDEIAFEMEAETPIEIVAQTESEEATSNEVVELVTEDEPQKTDEVVFQAESEEAISNEVVELVTEGEPQKTDEIAFEMEAETAIEIISQQGEGSNNVEVMDSVAEELGGCSDSETKNEASPSENPPIIEPITTTKEETIPPPSSEQYIMLKPDTNRSQPLVEAKFGYFFFTDSTMSSIYNKGGVDVQVSGSYPISEWFNFYGSVEYLQKSGRSLNGFQETTIRQIPLSLGLKAEIPILNHIKYYLSMGPRYFFVKSHNYSSYVPTHMSGNGIGGFANTGFLFTIRKHFTIDLFGEYSYGEITFHTSQSNVEGESAQIGGLTFGGGIGYSF